MDVAQIPNEKADVVVTTLAPAFQQIIRWGPVSRLIDIKASYRGIAPGFRAVAIDGKTISGCEKGLRGSNAAFELAAVKSATSPGDSTHQLAMVFPLHAIMQRRLFTMSDVGKGVPAPAVRAGENQTALDIRQSAVACFAEESS